MHPHFEFGGTPPLLYPCLGTAGTYWVPQGGKLRLIWSLSPCGTPVLSLLVANPISALQLLGGQRKRGALCLLPSPGDPPHCAPHLPSIRASHLCYGPTELPSSHGTPAPNRPPGAAWAPACTFGHAEGFGGLLAPPGMLGRRAFGVFWHVQACRGEAFGLLAPPAC